MSSAAVERIKCRTVPAPPQPDQSKAVLVATGDSLTSAYEQLWYSRTTCQEDTTADHRGLRGNNANFSYVGRYYDGNPNVVDYYNFARTGYGSDEILRAQKDVNEDTCHALWPYDKSPAGMAEEVVRNAKRAGYSAYFVTDGGVDDTNWSWLLRDLAICRGFEASGALMFYQPRNRQWGDWNRVDVATHGGWCIPVWLNRWGRPVAAFWSEIRTFDGPQAYGEIGANARELVRKMLAAGADRVAWMLYYDLTPAVVDFGPLMRHYAVLIPERPRRVLLEAIPESITWPVIDAEWHNAARQVQTSLNQAVSNGFVQGLTFEEWRRVRLVQPPIFNSSDMQVTAVGGSPHPSHAGNAKLAAALAGAVDASAKVTLLAKANNRFVSATMAGAGPLVAAAPRPLTWEYFDLIDRSDCTRFNNEHCGPNKIALRSFANNLYVLSPQTEPPRNLPRPLVAAASVVQSWEVFTKRDNQDGTISLLAHNGKWVTVDDLDEVNVDRLIASRAGHLEPQQPERFLVSPIRPVALRAAANNQYVTATGDDQLNELKANFGAYSSWHAFRIDRTPLGFDALLSFANLKYVTAPNGGLAPLVATKDKNLNALTAAEVFEWKNNGDGSVSLKPKINNHWVTATNAGSAPLVAARSGDPDQWEKFELVPLRTFALRSRANGTLVTAPNAGIDPLIANPRHAAGEALTWETFYEVDNGDGTISLFSLANNRFVTAQAAGQGPLAARATTVGAWEKFIKMTHSNGISLVAANGLLVQQHPDDGTPLTAKVPPPVNRNPGAWETFDVVEVPLVALRSRANGQLVVAANGGTNPLIASGPQVGVDQTFLQVDLGDGQFAFMAYGRARYVVAEEAGTMPLRARATEVGAWERFTVEQVPGGTGRITLKAEVNGQLVKTPAGGSQSLTAQVLPPEQNQWVYFYIDPLP